MHELSLAEGVLKIAEDAVRDAPGARIRSVVIEVGCLAGVEISALRFALDSVSHGGVMEGAQFELVELPGSAWCMQCSEAVPIKSHLDACPRCASNQLQTLSGGELRVRELRVIDPPVTSE